MIMFAEFNEILTVKDICSALHVGRNTAYELVRSGEINSIRVKDQYRIPKSALIEYVEKELKKQNIQ